MMYSKYKIINKKLDAEDTYIFTVSPKDGSSIFEFTVGQYAKIKNPTYENPNEEHPFSIASSPLTKDYLEFCIKVYGNWTKKLSEANVGDSLDISGPFGSFTWDNSIKSAVFLLGGIGISPIMSMLRFIKETNQQPNLTMIYGNRTPETIAYDKELREMETSIHLKIVDVFSHLPDNHPWPGYRGFITEDILKKEVDFSKKPVFFFIGPPIFVEKMDALLQSLGVKEENMRQELLG